MSDVEVDAAAEVAGSEPVDAVAGSDSTIEDGGPVAEGSPSEGPFGFGLYDGSRIEFDPHDRAAMAKELQKLNERLRHGSMRHEELSTEKARLTQQQKLVSDAIKRAQESESRANTSYSKYKPWDDLMTQNPALRREIEGLIDRHRSGGNKGGGVDDLKGAILNSPEFQEMRTGYEEWKKSRATLEEERAIADAVKQLKQDIPEYDEDKVSAFINELGQTPKQDGTRKLREIMHYALLGMGRAGELERKKAGVPVRPGVSSTPGKSSTGPSITDLSPEEQEAELIRRLQAIPDE